MSLEIYKILVDCQKYYNIPSNKSSWIHKKEENKM